MHATWQELNDWVDAALPADAAARVAAHVAECELCRAEVAAIAHIRRVAPLMLERAAGAVVAPPPRVAPRGGSGRRGAVRRWQLVAPLIGVGLAAGGLWWVRAPGAGVVEAPVVPIELISDDRAAVERRVEAQLAIIDAAIGELRVLLEAHPANAELRAQLAVAERDRTALGAMAREVLQGAYPGGGM
jgi:anti-sigma factor RsiW